ncbi:MAG: hypothetical protein D3924_20455, partial [Candidatus Electrothrix sp. AR4]|nr:hypothetical protein [Candidatus Electrothrix sp. AR4]
MFVRGLDELCGDLTGIFFYRKNFILLLFYLQVKGERMKLAVCAVFGLMLFAGPAVAEDQVTELKTEKQKISYALGLDLGSYFKGLGEDFDLSAIHQGVKDSYTGEKGLMTTEEAAEIQKKFAVDQRKKQMQKIAEKNTANKDAAEKFLKKNKGKKGVKSTDSVQASDEHSVPASRTASANALHNAIILL